MDNKHDILTTINRRTGMTVPDGYFDDFISRMEQSLPEHPAAVEERQQPKTLWLRVRPYVYMAAMFAGIWCMLNMFSRLSNGADLSIENNPVIANALSDDGFVEDYYFQNFDTEDLLEDMYDAGFEVDQLTDSTANDDASL